MGIYALVKQALLNRQQVHGWYKGHFRQMSPHVIGWNNEKAHALFYQFGGTSSSGQLPEWKCMDLEELRTVSVHDGPWYTGHEHSRSQTCVDQVDVEVT